MKKKLLFVIPSLEIGGAEKSLINLLHEIDYKRHDVDLFLMARTGFFMSQVPAEVNILPESLPFKNFSRSFQNAILFFLKRAEMNLVWNKLAFSVSNRIYPNSVHAEQRNWRYLKHFFFHFEKQYDVAIGYLEKSSNYIVTDCVKATRKIGWIHTDLEQLRLDFDFERKHLRKLDYIVTVSDGLTKRLKIAVPEFSSKIKTIENINSKKTIERLAGEVVDYAFDSAFTNVIFVGRLEKVKGLDMALDALDLLLRKHFKVRLYIIGDGSERNNLVEQAHRLGIISNVFFLGMKANPYPYIRNADIFILTSSYEGKSISLEEAKVLGKPIVITDFSSASDQILHQVTGLIAAKTPVSIACNLERIMTDPHLKSKLSANLLEGYIGTESEVQKLYNLIES